MVVLKRLGFAVVVGAPLRRQICLGVEERILQQPVVVAVVLQLGQKIYPDELLAQERLPVAVLDALPGRRICRDVAAVEVEPKAVGLLVVVAEPLLRRICQVSQREQLLAVAFVLPALRTCPDVLVEEELMAAGLVAVVVAVVAAERLVQKICLVAGVQPEPKIYRDAVEQEAPRLAALPLAEGLRQVLARRLAALALLLAEAAVQETSTLPSWRSRLCQASCPWWSNTTVRQLHLCGYVA